LAREDDLKIVASYYFPYEADLARSLLEAYDIPVWVLDVLQIQQRWYLAEALGGVKVAVLPADESRARELLTQDHSSEVPADTEAVPPPAPEDLCPHCGAIATAARAEHLPLRLRDVPWVVGGIVLAVPFRRFRFTWACSVCDHRWSDITR
jgi:hypothetical protein